MNRTCLAVKMIGQRLKLFRERDIQRRTRRVNAGLSNLMTDKHWPHAIFKLSDSAAQSGSSAFQAVNLGLHC